MSLSAIRADQQVINKYMQNKSNTQASRIFVFDILRIILIVLVVNLHIRIITNGQSNFLEPLTWFAVPLFVVLSFYFMSKYFLKERLDFRVIVPRIKRLFVPLLFWSFLGFIVLPGLFSLKNIILQVITGEVVNVPLYYLNLLILYTLIFWLLTYIPFRFRIVLYFVIVLLSFYLEYSRINYQLFYPTPEAIQKSYGRFIELLPYTVVGIFFGLLKNKLKRIPLLLLIGLSLILYIIAMQRIQPPGFHYSGLQIFFGTILFFSCVMVFSTSKSDRKVYRWIEVLGKYSFGVYLFHFILLQFLLQVFPYLKSYIAAFSIPFLIVYVGLCYGICILFNFLTHRRFVFLFE